MKSIVLDLEKDALTESSDVTALLRKAKVVAHKLNLKDFEGWTDKELKGYETTDKIPVYRSFKGEIKAWNPYHGWIPVVGQGQLDSLKLLPCRESIPELIELSKSESGMITLQFNDVINSLLNEMGNPYLQTKYALMVGINQVYAIIENTKSTILDWTLRLEDEGILGENLIFTSDEKKTAQENSAIKNYTFNFFGDVSDAQIQTDTLNSKQQRT